MFREVVRPLLNHRPRFRGAASWRICGAGVPPARAAETAAPQTGRSVPESRSVTQTTSGSHLLRVSRR